MFTKPIVDFTEPCNPAPTNVEGNGSLKKCCLGGMNNFSLPEG